MSVEEPAEFAASGVQGTGVEDSPPESPPTPPDQVSLNLHCR